MGNELMTITESNIDFRIIDENGKFGIEFVAEYKREDKEGNTSIFQETAEFVADVATGILGHTNEIVMKITGREAVGMIGVAAADGIRKIHKTYEDYKRFNKVSYARKCIMGSNIKKKEV